LSFSLSHSPENKYIYSEQILEEGKGLNPKKPPAYSHWYSFVDYRNIIGIINVKKTLHYSAVAGLKIEFAAKNASTFEIN